MRPLCATLTLLAAVSSITAFVPHRRAMLYHRNFHHENVSRDSTKIPNRRAFSASSTEMFFFRRKNDNEQKEPPKDKPDTTATTTSDESDSQNNDLFSFMKQRSNEASKSAASATTSPAPPSASSPSPSTLTSATEEAARLRSEADRARLEAERMDAELTLRKIERLEKELASATAAASKNDTSSATASTKATTSSRKSSEELQREMESLLRKVRGEKSNDSNPPIRTNLPQDAALETARASTNTASGLLSLDTKTEDEQAKTVEPVWPRFVMPYVDEDYQDLCKRLEFLPQFMLGTMALMVEAPIGTDPVTNKTLVNTTDLAQRMYQMQRLDMSFSSKPLPTFTKKQLADAEAEVAEIQSRRIARNASGTSAADSKGSGAWWSSGDSGSESKTDALLMAPDTSSMLQVMTDTADERLTYALDNEPQTVARLVLEYEYYITETEVPTDEILSMAAEEPWLKPFVSELSFTMVDGAADRLYPKCTTKRDSADKEKLVPTEAQVNQLVADVLPKANFRSTSKPEAVLGGFIIRGSTSLSGDAFITKLDAAMERSNLKDKMTVLYTTDFSVLSENKLPEDEPPILYVVASNVCRDAKPLQLSIISAIGLATSWYLSVYPFLLNPTIAARVDEQLAIADANMVPDLAWLTDASVPLFATFIGIQLVHELGHLIVAGSNKIQTTSPTFVPSLITGITSTVTTFKSPPLNKAAMFDFSVAGPLAGMVASMLAIVVGVQFTTMADPAFFPALPVEILRQSTLGGGIIEMGLGNGALNVPEGALGTAAVAGMTVPLHPIALAGYISLIVNALAILPVGTTDGGRVALALFGRGGKAAVGSIVFFVMLAAGLLGSDLLLFYFAFCIAFQAGNEIPARNEVDKLDLPRCFLAGLTYLVAFLAIVPFQ